MWCGLRPHHIYPMRKSIAYFTGQRIKALQDFSLTSAADLSLYFTCLQSNISFFFSKKYTEEIVEPIWYLVYALQAF